MANLKSSKKAAKQNIKRHKVNLARKTAIKTAVKKVYTAIETKQTEEQMKALLREAEAQLARAKGKGLIHANTASRKISRLNKAVAVSTASPSAK